MAARPKHRKVCAALLRRAQREIAPGATALDYAAAWIASGRRFNELAESIAAEIGESCSRSFLTFTAHRLSADAKARIQDARRAARDAVRGPDGAAIGTVPHEPHPNPIQRLLATPEVFGVSSPTPHAPAASDARALLALSAICGGFPAPAAVAAGANQ